MKGNSVKINSKRSKFFIIFIVAVLAIMAVALTGCSKHDEQAFFEKYGKEKAYMTEQKPYAIRHAPASVSYYLDSSVTGNYRTAVNYAISEANDVTSAINFGTTTSSKSAFVIKVENHGRNGKNAENLISTTFEGTIVESTLILNSAYLKNFNLNGIKNIVLHELGHTFGLADLESSTFKSYSVMYAYSSKNSKYFVEYQKFDEANIKWYYGD